MGAAVDLLLLLVRLKLRDLQQHLIVVVPGEGLVPPFAVRVGVAVRSRMVSPAGELGDLGESCVALFWHDSSPFDPIVMRVQNQQLLLVSQGEEEFFVLAVKSGDLRAKICIF